MTTPAVVERQLLDIDFSLGMSEAKSWESLDWTKYLRQVQNLDISSSGKATVRKGWLSPTGMGLSTTHSEFYGEDYGGPSPIGRLLATDTGVLCVSAHYSQPNAIPAVRGRNSCRLYQLDESGATSTGAWSAKNRLGDLSVKASVVAGIQSPTAASAAEMVGTASTTKYNAVVTKTGTSPVTYRVVVVDKVSNNVVANWFIYVGSAGRAACTAVDDCLFVFVTVTGGGFVRCFRYDLTSQSTLPTDYTQDLALTITGNVVGCVPDPDNDSAVVVTDSGNISRVSTAGSETDTGTVPGAMVTTHDIAISQDGLSDLMFVGLDATPTLHVVHTDDVFALDSTDNYGAEARFSAANFSIGGKDKDLYCVTANYVFTSSYGAQTLPVVSIQRVEAGSFGEVACGAGVGLVSSPFFSAANDDIYVTLVDLPQAGDGTGHDSSVVAGSTFVVNANCDRPWGSLAQVGSAHVSAVCDRYVDFVANATDDGYCNPQKAFTSDSGKTLTLAAVEKIGPQSYDVELRELRVNDMTVINASGDGIISGGKTSIYDGFTASEVGFVTTPAIIGNDTAAGAGLAAGTYNYVAVIECVDSVGRRHISKTSNPFSITIGATSTIDLEVTVPVFTDHTAYIPGPSSGTFNYHIKYHVYRTQNGGTQYYRVTSGTIPSTVSTPDVVVEIVDDDPDATIAVNELLHRQPGTQGTALDRFPAIASAACTKHKDRTFIARGNTLYYSSFDVFGEAPWFSPAFSIILPGAGPITGLASMDGTLVVFRAGSIYVVDGDGPPENGGSGTEFSPPRRLLCETGCTDARTVVLTNDGVYFRSARGIELLRRNLTVEFVGQSVQETTDSYPYTGGVAFDNATGRCVWAVGSAEGDYPGLLATSGLLVVYDTIQKSWTTYTKSGVVIQDVVCADVTTNLTSVADGFKLVLADSSRAYIEGSVYYDSVSGTNAFIPITLVTGWIRTNSLQDRVRVSDFTIGGKYQSPFNLTTQYAVNYDNSFTTVKTWTRYGDLISSQNVPQFEVQPPREAVQSMAFKIVTADPTPTAIGNGKQMDIFALTVKAGVIGGGAKLPSAQKG